MWTLHFPLQIRRQNNLPCDTPPGRRAETVWLSCHMIELLQTPIIITHTHLSSRIPALNRENNFCSGVEIGDQSRVIRECVVCVRLPVTYGNEIETSLERPLRYSRRSDRTGDSVRSNFHRKGDQCRAHPREKIHFKGRAPVRARHTRGSTGRISDLRLKISSPLAGFSC